MNTTTQPITDKRPCNYLVFSWIGRFNHWVARDRHFDLKAACEYTAKFNGAVIDLLSGKMVAKDGKYCSRKRPQGIKALPAVQTWCTVPAPADQPTVTADEAERRDLHHIGSGSFDYHVTLWGDSAPKVQIGVYANDPAKAELLAIQWGRAEWWRDERKIGIEKVELVLSKEAI